MDRAYLLTCLSHTWAVAPELKTEEVENFILGPMLTTTLWGNDGSAVRCAMPLWGVMVVG